MTESFIADLRREQIILACIDVLEDVGYTKLSLTKVARKAKVSTGLISYHFNDKNDLMNHTLEFLIKSRLDYISGKVAQVETLSLQLEVFIEASLAYQETHYKNNIALIEIVLNARNEKGTPYYRMEEEEEDLIILMLKEILEEGQKSGEFSRDFHPDMLCSVIHGAIEEKMLNSTNTYSIEAYKTELINIIRKIIY